MHVEDFSNAAQSQHITANCSATNQPGGTTRATVTAISE